MLAVLATVLIFSLDLRSSTWLSLVFALGFVHYLLGLLYARRQTIQVLAQPHSRIPAVLVLGLGAALYYQNVPLYIYFAIHHAFNEVYVRDPLHAHLDGAARRRTTAVVFHASAYMLILTAQKLPAPALILVASIVVGSFAAYMLDLVRIRAKLGWAGLADLCTIEIVIIALVPIAFFYQFQFIEVVLYHFLFWAVYPLVRMLERRGGGVGPVAGYLGLTLGALAVFWFISPAGSPHYKVPVELYYDQFVFWSYVHITLSFALSRAHPDWITRWFSPRPETV